MAENLHPEMNGKNTLSFKGPRVLRRKCQRNFLPGHSLMIDTATSPNLR